MNNELNLKLFDFIALSPTAFHTVSTTAAMLRDAGYRELCESDEWRPEPGAGYFTTRNGSSLIAFRYPADDFCGYMMTAAHGDSPAFKIKENSELDGKDYIRFSTEKYGGMLCSSWMDRPLSVAGRVTLRTADGIEIKNVDLCDPVALIPNVAIHMNRNANDGASFNAAVDMLPLYALGEGEKVTLRARVAEALGVRDTDILTTDLFVYNTQRGIEWNGMISAPRLDDLQCVFASLCAFIESGKSGEASGAIPMFCLFDNEEVGSQTKQGAASTFLADTLERISAACGRDCRRLVANSFLVSCDNAHAIHPNHPEYTDKGHGVALNGGVVLKHNANQRYTTDAVSAAIFRTVCAEAGVAVQDFTNRADLAGGSTLGNIANTQVSLNTVDIGLPQLAMHSAWETAGAEDTASLVQALTVFYGKTLQTEGDGVYRLI